jgi:Na+-translocating ferredoxin:NAD+ oxidoreductase RNF subunit RnfB
MFESVLSSVLWLGGLGLVFGAVLAYAAKKFEVPADPKIEQIRQLLPGANCGGCGYAGCDDLARAIASGETDASACAVISSENLANLNKLTGGQSGGAGRKKAVIMCQGAGNISKRKFDYYGVKDCREAMIAMQGDKVCEFGCLGYGTCQRVCPNEAIKKDPASGQLKVDESKCIGCGKCEKVCPKNVIKMIPADQSVRVLCRSTKKGKEIKDICASACIGCGLCEKQCKFDAIKMVDNLPVIDYEKCTNCGACAEKCPTKAIKKI